MSIILCWVYVQSGNSLPNGGSIDNLLMPSSSITKRVMDAITLLRHVGRFHNYGICQLYYVGFKNKVRIIFVEYSYILTLGILGEVMSLTLFT